MVAPDLLESFVAFAEALNFTHAARRVGLSQPALHERVRRIEQELGAPLYERRGRELALTDAGARCLAYARDERVRRAELMAELRHERPRRAVTLAAGEGSYLYLLGPAIAGFAREADADLELVTLGGRAVVEALRRGDAHLAVAAIDVVPASVTAHDLVTTPLCAALPARHPLAKRKTLRVADLRDERFVLAPEGQLHRELATRAIASGRGGRAPGRVTEADGWPLMLAFVRMGLGVAIVNGTCELPKGVVARPVPELGSVTYRLLRRKSAALSPEAEDLAARIRALGAAARTLGS